MSEVKKILNERAKTHGDFDDVAYTYCELQNTFYGTYGYGDGRNRLNHKQRLAIDMICQKLARIKGGDANFKDHWLDIAGYATLVVNELERFENGNE